ncbi:MAG: polysaccharide biosynthesis tyrosine autokinase [Polyangiaceae bacterium]|nr:polysaccharide biosynthesis tyrosine autokinase [Polyangiaceae bacterium]
MAALKPRLASGPNAGGTADRQPIVDLLALWRPIRKYWITTLMIAVGTAVAAGFWTMGQPKIYEATATVQFDPNPPRPLGNKVDTVVEMGSGAVWDTREYYETQYQILQSRRVALAVVRQLGLEHDGAFLMNLPPNQKPPANFQPWSEEDAADNVRWRIRVEAVKQSRIALVRFQDANPERAARILKTIVEVYREANLETALESTDDAAQWLRTEHDKLSNELEKNETALHEFKKEKNILSVDFDDKSNLLREEIGQLNQALTAIRIQREQVSARRNQLAKVKGGDPAVLPANELLQSNVLSSLRSDYVATVREVESLKKSGLGSNHPDMLAAVAQSNTARDALLAEVRNIQGSLDNELRGVMEQEGGVSGLYDKARNEALELNLNEIEYNKRRRAKENTEKLYALVLERAKESDMARRLRVNNVTIVDEPTVPKGPIKPNVPLNIAGGIIVGLLLGIGAAYGRGLLDRTVKTPDDVEAILNTTFLGLIPEIDPKTQAQRRRRRAPGPQAAPELVVHHTPLSGTAEAARAVRTNLLFMAPDKPFRTLLVTSAGPAEGKTTVACCVATAMAQAGKRVLLIDADLRRPRVHRIFGGRGMSQGLTSALLDENAIDVSIETEVPNLRVLPAGPLPPNPSELLQSERFKAYLRKMSERYDQVILDSPPIVAVTDAVILSTTVDATVLVVRAFKTTKDLAKHALRQLQDISANMAGTVLNAVNLSKDEYRYSYQYYRRDNYYSTDAHQPTHGPDGGGSGDGASASPPN